MRPITLLAVLILSAALLPAQDLSKVEKVEAQPLIAQVRRVIEAMDYLGAPISAADKQALHNAMDQSDAARAVAQTQDILDRYCLFVVNINPESRVKVDQGPAKPELVEQGWRTFLVKVHNEAGVTAQLKAESRNALPVYARSRQAAESPLSHSPKQTLTQSDVANRWLDAAMFDKQPLRPQLSGLELEYRIIQLYSRDSGKREAKISFNVGQGTQDIGFRNDVDTLFDCAASTNVTLRVADEHGKPTTASFLIRDAQGRVYPSLAKRLAPDFAFHPQVYRADGERAQAPSRENTP